MTDHRRKTYSDRQRSSHNDSYNGRGDGSPYGRSYSRSHRRQRRQSNALPIVIVVFLVLLIIGILVVGLVPGAKEKAKNYTAAAAERIGITGLFNRTGDGSSEGDASALHDASSGHDASAGDASQDADIEPTVYFYATEEAETNAQVISVIRPTEPEPETQAPPKYSANENTKLIGVDAKPLTFTFAGDILFDDRYAVMASWLQRPGGTSDLTNVFDDGLIALMRDADVFMVNNEFPYSERGTALAGKKYTFRADPANVKILTAMGADIVSLANNHMYDYGEAALLDTLGTLQQEGIPYVGAGTNLEEASSPYYFTNGDVKIGIVSATQIERLANPDTRGATEDAAGVFRCLNSENLTEKIKKMKTECDFVIAYLHWGTESTENIDEHQTKLAKAAVEAGVDLIIGDHPHVLQKIGFVDGVPVVYSLGNYLFNSNAQDTCLVTASIDPQTGKLVSLQFVPARQIGCRTKLLEGDEKKRVLDYMRSLGDTEYDENGFVKLTE